MAKSGFRLAWRVIRYEIGLWRSLFRWLLRRPRTNEPGAELHPYAGASAPLIWAFIVMNAIEVPVVHLALPWEHSRNALLVLGIWGLAWMVGLLASLKIHPHTVGPSGLRVRYGISIDLTIPWSAIDTVKQVRRDLEKGRSVQFDGTILHVVQVKQTNVQVSLREPIVVPRHDGDHTVTEVNLWADEPKDLLKSVRAHLTADVA
ncbi:hypothetical protein [Tenggerimyces flavus]|uniref:PH domain-containing protein n=1 Tax=Tenggerimyces flavus TaxID=1708749 RepID=A0ABV7Y2V0_9ACTN|nr:hypothetical protein [Tenggerimyces flavus]MBM7790585.1 hypothetical protein [Tenggerimyces flavus]